MLHKRIVIDTGILISASIWGGVPREALRKAKEDCVLIFTQDTLFELTRNYPQPPQVAADFVYPSPQGG